MQFIALMLLFFAGMWASGVPVIHWHRADAPALTPRQQDEATLLSSLSFGNAHCGKTLCVAWSQDGMRWDIRRANIPNS